MSDPSKECSWPQDCPAWKNCTWALTAGQISNPIGSQRKTINLDPLKTVELQENKRSNTTKADTWIPEVDSDRLDEAQKVVAKQMIMEERLFCPKWWWHTVYPVQRNYRPIVKLLYPEVKQMHPKMVWKLSFISSKGGRHKSLGMVPGVYTVWEKLSLALWETGVPSVEVVVCEQFATTYTMQNPSLCIQTTTTDVCIIHCQT